MWYCGIVVLRWSMIQWWWGWIRTEDGEREILANIYIFIIIFTYSYLLDDVLMHTLRSGANRRIRRETRDIYTCTVFIFTRWWCTRYTLRSVANRRRGTRDIYIFIFTRGWCFNVHTEKSSEPKVKDFEFLHRPWRFIVYCFSFSNWYLIL